MAHTKGQWTVNHWEKGDGGVSCLSNSGGITRFSGGAISEEYYQVVSKVDPMAHSVQGSFEGAHIAKIVDFKHQDGGTEARDNAILISAAPDLLEALELCLPYMQDMETENIEDPSVGLFQDHVLTGVVNKMKAAIEKAKGTEIEDKRTY